MPATEAGAGLPAPHPGNPGYRHGFSAAGRPATGRPGGADPASAARACGQTCRLRRWGVAAPESSGNRESRRDRICPGASELASGKPHPLPRPARNRQHRQRQRQPRAITPPAHPGRGLHLPATHHRRTRSPRNRTRHHGNPPRRLRADPAISAPGASRQRRSRTKTSTSTPAPKSTPRRNIGVPTPDRRRQPTQASRMRPPAQPTSRPSATPMSRPAPIPAILRRGQRDTQRGPFPPKPARPLSPTPPPSRSWTRSLEQQTVTGNYEA